MSFMTDALTRSSVRDQGANRRAAPEPAPRRTVDQAALGDRPLTRITIVALTAALLAGCAENRPAIDHLPGGRVVGDAERVSVAGPRWDALPFAVAHCARFGRSAQFDRAEGERSVFRCVARP
jgi:hypothetical protein